MSDPKRARLVPSLFLSLMILAMLAVIAWLQFTEGTGDTGMNNPFSYMAAMLIAAMYGLWFLFFSGQPGKVRLGALVAVALVGLFLRFGVRIDGWTGNMLPRLSWAWEEQAGANLAAGTEAAGEEAKVDLVTTTKADFPGYLGKHRDGRVSGVLLRGDWEANPPEPLWKQPCGSGWSGVAVVNGIAVTHEQRGEQQLVVARSLADGAELWRYATDAVMDHQLGGEGPHATPLIHGGRVYALDTDAHLVCLDGADGSLVWEHDLRVEYGISDEQEQAKIQYGRSNSPLAVGELLIVPVGGNPEGRFAGLVAFDLVTGELRWEGPGRHVSHASPTVGTLAGRQQIVVTNEDTLSGHDPATGELLWEHPWPGQTGGDANTTTPQVLPGDRVLISKGYGQGSTLLDIIVGDDGSFAAKPQWASRRALRTKLTTSVVDGDHAYALSDGILECTDLVAGKRVWRDGRYGHGQVLLVGDKLLVTSEEGELLLVEASPEQENQVVGRLQALDGLTWNSFALYGDIAVLRNGQEMGAWRLPTVQH